MHEFNIAMGEKSLREERRRILTGAVVAAIPHPTRELLAGIYEAIHSGRQFRVVGSEGGIRFH